VSNKFCEEVKMKKLYVVIGLLALVAFATVGLAVGPGAGPVGVGPGWAVDGSGPQGGPGAGFHSGRGSWAADLNLTKEQQDQLGALRKRLWEEVKPLREQVYQKKQEMRDLYTSPAADADDATIVAKQKELNGLQQQMQDKMVQFRLEQRKVFTPEQLNKLKEMPYGHGSGACGGHGKGWGRGRG
jgi:Spy/CpxP family protein refolding chaperone